MSEKSLDMALKMVLSTGRLRIPGEAFMDKEALLESFVALIIWLLRLIDHGLFLWTLGAKANRCMLKDLQLLIKKIY